MPNTWLGIVHRTLSINTGGDTSAGVTYCMQPGDTSLLSSPVSSLYLQSSFSTEKAHILCSFERQNAKTNDGSGGPSSVFNSNEARSLLLRIPFILGYYHRPHAASVRGNG
ncbi:hypothetical protein AcV5_002955 [Taiwanofungus camphoratus]|nr:hypothetical protein AcV5_002955 [Antrodia cinnamomea]